VLVVWSDGSSCSEFSFLFIYDLEGIETVFQRVVNKTKLKLNSDIPTERPPPVGEVSANFCG